jgi:phage gp36-like protein
MPYATLQDLIDRYGEDELIERTDRLDPPAGVIDVAIANQALADADAEIDGYLQSRYQLPLANPPAVLKLAACKIARHNLYDDAETEKIANDYAEVLAWLRGIAKGVFSLGPATDGTTAPETDGPKTQGPGRTFTREGLQVL